MSTIKIAKTGITRFVETKKSKDTIKERWEDDSKGAVYEKMLIEYTKQYIKDCEALQKEVGSDIALKSTVAGMKNLKALEGRDDSSVVKIRGTCKSLIKLVNLSGKLMHEHNFSQGLIIKTKNRVYGYKE